MLRCRSSLAAWQPTGAVEQREPRRGAAAARRAVDLAVREDGDVPLGERILALLLPEDHAVDVAKLRLERVDDVVPRLDLALELAAELDQARQLGRLDALLERGVERAAERDVDGAVAELERLGPDERGHVPEPNRARRGRPRRAAQVSSRPEGTSTTTRFSPSDRSTTPSSSAQVTSAIVPWPQAVE